MRYEIQINGRMRMSILRTMRLSMALSFRSGMYVDTVPMSCSALPWSAYFTSVVAILHSIFVAGSTLKCEREGPGQGRIHHTSGRPSTFFKAFHPKASIFTSVVDLRGHHLDRDKKDKYETRRPIQHDRASVLSHGYQHHSGLLTNQRPWGKPPSDPRVGGPTSAGGQASSAQQQSGKLRHDSARPTATSKSSHFMPSTHVNDSGCYLYRRLQRKYTFPTLPRSRDFGKSRHALPGILSHCCHVNSNS